MAYLTVNLHDLKPVVRLEPEYRHGNPIRVQLSPQVYVALSVADASALAGDLQKALAELAAIPPADPILRGNADLVSEHASLGKAA